jgi:hypothetical protein
MLALGALGGYHYRNYKAEQESEFLERRLTKTENDLASQRTAGDYTLTSNLSRLEAMSTENALLKRDLENAKRAEQDANAKLSRAEWEHRMKLYAKNLERELSKHYQGPVSATWDEQGFIDPDIRARRTSYQTQITARASGMTLSYSHYHNQDGSNQCNRLTLTLAKDGNSITLESRLDKYRDDLKIPEDFTIMSVTLDGKTYSNNTFPVAKDAHIPLEELSWAKAQLNSDDFRTLLKSISHASYNR